MKKYVFRKYGPKYQSFFTSEKKKLVKVLGSLAKIEHVGSTAIPKLGGKGIIDIVVGVSKSKMPKSKQKLEKAGYEFRKTASTSERLFFRKDYLYQRKKRRVHLHLLKFSSQEWNNFIYFRDYLLNHPEAVKQYIKIKKDAVKKSLGDGKIYKKYKSKFIKNIISQAR
ncbi:MAG: GrpB family protein [Nanoarchaeota archaeon]|mgnify:CR=1 FL=1